MFRSEERERARKRCDESASTGEFENSIKLSELIYAEKVSVMCVGFFCVLVFASAVFAVC